MRVIPLSLTALAVALCAAQPAVASQQSDAKGFVEGTKASIKARNMYMNRDNRADNATQSYGEEWAQGFIGTLNSGFTQGTVGFGIDLIGQAAYKLDTGGGRRGGGTGLMELDGNGDAKSEYSKAGGAVKMQISNTVLKYGTQIMSVPVFATSDSRLLMETADGFSVVSSEITNLKLAAGHFTSLTNRNSSNRDNAKLTSIDYLGGTYNFTKQLSAGLYYSDVEDYWRKYYTNVNYVMPLSDSQALKFDFNAYDTKSQGDKLGGDLDNRIGSFTAAYSMGAHTFLLGYQQVSGDGNYVYSVDGNSTIFVGNSVQYSDFNYADEKSYQARYDINLATYGVPGLSFMARYVKGTDIDTATTSNGKAWERDLEAKYVVQSGPAKDLSFRVRQATYRSEGPGYGGQVDDIRLITEYPFNIL